MDSHSRGRQGRTVLAEEPGDLSNIGDYEQFRGLLMTCLKRCYDALEPGGRMAVLMSGPGLSRTTRTFMSSLYTFQTAAG